MREPKTVVIRLTPQIRLVIFGIVAILVAIFVLSFFWGSLSAIDRQYDFRSKHDKLVAEINGQAIAINDLKQRLAVAEKSSEIDRIAAVDLKVALTERYEVEAQLLRDLAFYKKLMAPDELDKGFTIDSVDLSHSQLAGDYRYKIVATNAGGGSSVIKGSMVLKVSGIENGGEKELLISQLPDFQGESPQKLRFRFFQNIAGEFKLPADFQPVSMLVEAQVGGRKTPYRGVYPWQDILTAAKVND